MGANSTVRRAAAKVLTPKILWPDLDVFGEIRISFMDRTGDAVGPSETVLKRIYYWGVADAAYHMVEESPEPKMLARR